MLRVAVDLTPLLTPRTGVGVFTAELVTRLAWSDELTLTGFAVTWRGRGQLPAAVPEGVTVVDRPMPARPLREAWKRGDRPSVDRWIGRHDVVWGPNFVVPPTRAATLVTVHDLTPLRYPQLANAATLAYPVLIRRALRRGTWVHTPSAFVRDEVITAFGAPPERVVAIHHGVRRTAPGDTASGRRLAGAERYVLALGTVEPRKDLPSLVAAFDALAADHPDVRLVIAGPDGWGAEALTEAIGRAHHGHQIVRLGWVSDDDRQALLRGAAVFCYPSVYEGFGLPPLEAMSAGVPVVATSAGALPEVCGAGADLVPTGDTAALRAALVRALDDEAHRAELIARGTAALERFEWSRTAEAFAGLIHRVAGTA